MFILWSLIMFLSYSLLFILYSLLLLHSFTPFLFKFLLKCLIHYELGWRRVVKLIHINTSSTWLYYDYFSRYYYSIYSWSFPTVANQYNNSAVQNKTFPNLGVIFLVTFVLIFILECWISTKKFRCSFSVFLSRK